MLKYIYVKKVINVLLKSCTFIRFPYFYKHCDFTVIFNKNCADKY